MPANNRSAHPFYIIAGTMVCLLALSAVNNSFSLQGFTTRRVDLLADIKTDHPVLKTSVPVKHETAAPVTAAADTAAADNSPLPVYDYMTYTGIQEYEDTTGVRLGLRHFLTALSDLKKGKRKKVRVAYFGDSMIEADLITGDLRDSLQARFGGAGVGFVSMTSVVATWRTSIRHTFSEDWKDYSFKSKPPADVLLGIAGHAFVPSHESWVKYGSVPAKPGLDRFNEVHLFYGPAAGDNVTINGKPYALNGANPVNELSFPQGALQNAVTLQYGGDDTPPVFYGVSFESDNGVYVDNFSFRGITGLELGQLSRSMVQQMQQQHPYDLVVIHYGANILFRPELTDYSWYEASMQKVMDSLCHNWPNTSFLVVGTADKSYLKNDHYVTIPGVAPLLKAQHALAQRHGTAYWNLYAAMGGEGSMARWVEEEPAHGKKDHTHFTTYGASRVGALMYKAIMNEFKEEAHP